MTTNGRVNHDRKPVVALLAASAQPDGGVRVWTGDAIVDTGFTGALSLPTNAIGDLNPVFRGVERVTLADGSEAWVPTYIGFARVSGIGKSVVIFGLNGDPLVGMTFLEGLQLVVNAWPNGDVVIQHPPP